jgi:hypothetical protein
VRPGSIAKIGRCSQCHFVRRSNEWDRWFTLTDNQIEWAKQRLLATGFDAPEQWLTVKALGTLSFSASPLPQDQPDSPIIHRLAYEGADLPALDNVLKQMRAALYRLGANLTVPFDGVERLAAEEATGTAPPTQAKLSPNDLAEKYGLPPRALRKRLDRWRYEHDAGYAEVSNSAVLPIIEAMRAKSVGRQRAADGQRKKT